MYSYWDDTNDKQKGKYMIAITGGGTGGHLAIAKSFNARLVNKGHKSVFIGSTSGQDILWFKNDENFTHKYFLQSKGVVNRRGIDKILSVLNIIKLALKCAIILKKHKVKAVISVGGYSAAPASIAAIITKTPLFIHEQNAVMGKLNSLLKPFAKGFYSSYIKPFYPYPVRDEFFDAARIRHELKTVLFMGGSQGATAINNLAVNLSSKLKEHGIKITHQCGKGAYDDLCARYEAIGVKVGTDVDLFEFSSDMPKLLSKADVAITRAGASSLWESVANALVCIFIPYPHAASNHQYHNAKFLSDQGLAKIIMQDDINENEMLEILNTLDIKEISTRLAKILTKDKSNEVIDDIINLM